MSRKLVDSICDGAPIEVKKQFAEDIHSLLEFKMNELKKLYTVELIGDYENLDEFAVSATRHGLHLKYGKVKGKGHNATHLFDVRIHKGQRNQIRDKNAAMRKLIGKLAKKKK